MLHGLHRFLRAIDEGAATGDPRVLLRTASRVVREVLGADHCLVRSAGAPGLRPLHLLDGDVLLDAPAPPPADAPRVLRRAGTPLPGLVRTPAHVVEAPLSVAAARGALVLTRDADPGFDEDDEQAVGIAALALGAALESVLLAAAERSARGTASRAALLERITGLLQTSATAAEIVERIPAAVIEVLGCRAASLHVLEGEHLVGDTLPPLPAPVRERLRRVHRDSDNPVSEVVRTGAPVVLGGVDVTRYRDLAEVDPARLGTTLVVPLAGREEVLGALSVGWGERSPLEHGDLDLFASVASQVAVALERAQLLDAERTSRTRLARSHEALGTLARDLQRGLLPTRLPQHPGLQVATRYAPALAGSEIGGDWYDAVPTATGVVFVIGDVQGHSTRAAGLMGQVRTAVRAYVSEGHDPSAVLERTNRLLVELDAPLFATCCLVRLDTATGILSIATAGHPPPLVVDGSGPHEVDADPGPPLGVLPGAVYPLAVHRLLGPSALVLHTDGVVEVLGEGSEAGEAALRDALRAAPGPGPARSAEELASGVMTAIPHELTDDAALLVATFAGAASGRLEATLWLPPDVRAVASAREFLRSTLGAWSAEDLLDEAELVLSELVTNALVHAEGGAGVTLTFDGAADRLTISVHDSSPRRPRERRAGPDALGGRGLGIVEAVADDWGVRVEGSGKTVWAELAVETA